MSFQSLDEAGEGQRRLTDRRNVSTFSMDNGGKVLDGIFGGRYGGGS